MSVNQEGIDFIEQYHDRINKVLALINRNGTEEDANKVLGGLYMAFGLTDSSLNAIVDNAASMDDTIQDLVEVETSFANVGVTVR